MCHWLIKPLYDVVGFPLPQGFPANTIPLRSLLLSILSSKQERYEESKKGYHVDK